MKALWLHQPYATLIETGVKRWETRSAPPNGPMRPDGVRGMPGLPIEPGERIAIVAAVKVPADGLRLGPRCPVVTQEYLVDHAGGSRYRLLDLCNSCAHPIPLGVVVCTAVVAEALPIVDDYEDACSAYEGPAAIAATPSGMLIEFSEWAGALEEGDGHDITDQLPYGDWRPGRWAWRLTDVEPVPSRPEPIVTRGNRQGVCEIEVTW